MPTPMIPLTIQAPGYKGLNYQQASTSLDMGWATELNNAVFDLTGRVTARKGITALTTSGSPGAYNLEQVFCYEGFTSNAPFTGVLSAGNLKLYGGTTTLVDRTGTITAPTANNWQFMNFGNDEIIAVQQAHTPIRSNIVGGVLSNFADITASSGTVPRGNCGIAAYGRLFIADEDGLTVKYSALLDKAKWAAADGAGSIDTTLYWPNGRDYIVALAAWEEKLVIFGKHNILIYGSPAVNVGFVPASMYLTDVIEGTGCMARDSVQHVGSDVVFLSASGVRSLKKSLITTKNPLDEISLPIRDLLLQYTDAATLSNVRSAFHQREGLYILSIVGSSITTTFCFDMKAYIRGIQEIDTGAVKCSIWTGWTIHGMSYGRDGILYVSYRDGSNEEIGKYAGYTDNGTNYSLGYASPWIDLASPEGGESGAFLKLPKKATITTAGSSSYQITLGIAFDFEGTGYIQSTQVTSNATASEWGVSEWGIAEWGASGKSVSQSKVNLARSGQHMRLSISIPISGYEISLQKVDLFFKRGRTSY